MGSGGSKALWSSAKLAWFVVGLIACHKQAAQGPNRLAERKVVSIALMRSAYSHILLHNCPILNVYTQLHQLYGQASRAISTG